MHGQDATSDFEFLWLCGSRQKGFFAEGTEFRERRLSPVK